MHFSFLRRGALFLLLLAGCAAVCAPQETTAAARQQAADRRFLLNRGLGASVTSPNAARVSPQAATGSVLSPGDAVVGLRAARSRRAAIANATPGAAQPLLSSNPTTWQPAGPIQLGTPAYGLVTGRISSLAVDPNDASGNTVYLGATGGGVWKSTNAAGNAGSVTFQPETDDLSAFQGSPYIPSLSIGALTVSPYDGTVLAGTGDPNDALDSYYGAGILRSAGGGNTWTQIAATKDFGASGYSFVGAGFAGFAWSGTTPNLVVAAVSQSAEGLLVNAGANLEGSPMAGLYYSKDDGKTWYLATITDGTNQIIQSSNPAASPPGNPATSVVWNPKRNLFLAAVRFHGYYSSSDGVTWTRLANQPGANLTTTVCPANPRGLGSPQCPIFRGVLAVQPVTGDTFALTTDLNNVDGGAGGNGKALGGLYQDVCSSGGTAVSSCNTSNTITWGTKISDAALDAPDGTIPQADYNLALSAVPTQSQQDTLLFAGTEDIFRCSLANSCQWRNTTNNATCAAAQVAPSIHAIDGTLWSNQTIFFGNDGGLWRTTDDVGQTGSVCASTDASHFANLNGGIGSLAEISHLAVSPTNGSLVLAGMGEFGIVGSENAAAQGGTGAWQQLLTGEGSYVAIDPATPANWYADAFAGVGIFPCVNGGNCTGSGFGNAPAIGRAQVENDTDYFLDPAPWILDPGNTANILLGTCRMWLGPATGGWSGSNLISGMLDGDGAPFCNGNAYLRSVAAGGSYNAGGERMYAGMAGPLDGGASVPGHLYGATVPQGGGVVTWSDLWRNPVTNLSMSQQFNGNGNAVSSIAVDPHDPSGKTLYVGIAGFQTGQNGVLYGSTDGGARWANLTNTLPLEPVSKVVVDPNNGSYVYVAGDFGVYQTKNIANCSGTGANYQNCWTQLGSGLPNAPVTDLQVYNNGSNAVLEASTYGRGIWTLGLATSSVPAQASLSPSSASFQAAGVNSQSATTASFTLQNTGGVSLIIGQIATVPSDYTQTMNNCGSALAPGTNCTIQIAFTPTTTGDRPGTLTVHANTQSGALAATLDGTGLTPGMIAASPNSLVFQGPTSTGSSSSPMNVQVQNTGQATVTLKSRSITGTNSIEFSLGTGSTCGSSLSANATCTVPVVFTPSQPGTRTAQLQIVSSGNSVSVNLSGYAVTPAHLTLSSTSLSFPDTGLGNTSASQSITVQNTGGAAAQLGSATISSDYKITSNACGSTLAGGASCTVNIAFAPTGTGSRSGLFTQPASNIPAGQVTAALSGNGLPAPVLQLTPPSVSFGNQQQGTTSGAQPFTLRNTGGSPAQFGTFTVSDADFAIASNSCGSSLAVNASCQITVTFTPTGSNPYTATLTVPYSSTSISAALSGTGTAQGKLAFSPASYIFPATADNATSTIENITVTNTGGNPATLSGFAISGPFAIANNDCPQSLAKNAQCTLGITFSPPGTAPYTGGVTLTGNFSNSPAPIPLSGQGASPANASLSPGSMTFSNTAQGSASAAQTFTVTSTGGVPVTLGTPGVSTADYQISRNTCPASLNPSSACFIDVLFHPGSTGLLPATFTLPGNMLNSPLTASLSGTGTPPGVLTISPAKFSFGSLVTGTTSTPQAFQIANTGSAGSASISPGTLAIVGDYAISSNTCSSPLAPGGSCTVSVTFTPTQTGDRPGRLTVPGDGAEPSAVSTLDGAGTTPGQLVFAPLSVAFGNVATDSAANNAVTVSNGGGTAVHLSAISATGDFSVTGGTCSPATVLSANGANSCTVFITFKPSVTGPRSGTLTLANDGAPASAQVPLNGNGIAPGNLTLSPGNLDFGAVIIGSKPPPQKTVSASNGGDAPVTLQAPSITGSGYSIPENNCGATLAAHASCTFQVSFNPTQPLPPTGGSVSIAWQDAGTGSGTANSTLNGTGVTPGALTFTPSPVQFSSPPVVVGSTASLTVSVRNTGGIAVPLGAPSTTSGFGVTNGCPGSLAPNATCTVQVTFSPSSTGPAQPGLLTFPASDGSRSWPDALSGTGAAPGNIRASLRALNFPPTVVGSTSAAQQVTFTNSGDVSVPLNPPQVSSPDYSLTGTTCSASLAAKSSCTISIAFKPRSKGDRNGGLTLASSQAGVAPANITLDGTGLAPAQLAFSPASFAFGGQPERTTSAPQTFTLINSGDVSTGLKIPVLTGQYAIVSNNCSTTLGAGSSCGVAVQFAPVSGGSQPGTLSIASTSGTPAATANLSGDGLVLIISGTVPVFPPTLVGSSIASPQVLTVENLGATPVNLTTLTLTGDFAQSSNSCGQTLAANTSCSFYVIFKPTTDGVRTGTFTVSDGAETYSISFTGTGLFPATDKLSTNALVFPPTQFGQKSPAQAVVLTNSGDSALTQICAYFSSPSECLPPLQSTTPFGGPNNCGASLGGHSSCSIAVQFIPTAVGGESGTLTIKDYTGVGTLHTQTVTLSGQGTAPPGPFASPASINFGSYALQAATSSQTITISNPAATDLTALAVVKPIDPDFSVSSSTCGSTLAAGASCQVGVVFNPGAIGNLEGVLVVTGNLAGFPEKLQVSLAGAGEDYQVTASCGPNNPSCTVPTGGVPTAVITNGSTANYVLSVTPTGASTGSLAITCSGAPANSVCTANPSTVAIAGGTAGSVQLSIATNTAVTATARMSPVTRWWAGGVALAMLCPVILLRGAARRRLLTAAIAILLLSSPIACGVHASGVNNSKNSTPAGQTPTGTYTVTVNAAYPGAQRTATVQLVVQ